MSVSTTAIVSFQTVDGFCTVALAHQFERVHEGALKEILCPSVPTQDLRNKTNKSDDAVQVCTHITHKHKKQQQLTTTLQDIQARRETKGNKFIFFNFFNYLPVMSFISGFRGLEIKRFRCCSEAVYEFII